MNRLNETSFQQGYRQGRLDTQSFRNGKLLAWHCYVAGLVAFAVCFWGYNLEIWSSVGIGIVLIPISRGILLVAFAYLTRLLRWGSRIAHGRDKSSYPSNDRRFTLLLVRFARRVSFARSPGCARYLQY
jgi:hypothetical protein